ncbi:MAG: hypothetical protein K2X81_14305, partial [Candidatus Obscuribacterales bacterium]|nr:hypothetical protein [Candidatus Obscuribacterales bacterium]
SDIACGTKDQIAAVWDDKEKHVIFVSKSVDGGKIWTEPKILSASGANASHPRILFNNDLFQVFWTETAATHSQINLAKCIL